MCKRVPWDSQRAVSYLVLGLQKTRKCCHPSVPHPALSACALPTQVIDRSRDPFYYGDVRVMIFNVPLKTDNDQTEVSKTAWRHLL